METLKTYFSLSYLLPPASGIMTYYSLKDSPLELRVLASATVAFGTLGVVFFFHPPSQAFNTQQSAEEASLPSSHFSSSTSFYSDEPYDETLTVNNSLQITAHNSPNPSAPPFPREEE